MKVKIVEPGMIKTEIGSRSMQYGHDESLTEYQGLAESLSNAMAGFAENASEARVVAYVIYGAGTSCATLQARKQRSCSPDARY